MISKYKTRGAYHYDWLKTEEWYKACVDRCVEFCKGSTLDVGCGDGVVTKKILDNGYSVLGIDNDEDGLKLAREHGVPVSNIDLDGNFISNSNFRYMVCLNVIEHLDKPDGILRIFKKNITKAGIIITDVPQKNPSKYHVKEYTPKELADLFSDYRVVPFQIDENFHGIEVYK